MKYISTSVKTGKNVEESFMSLARMIIESETKPMAKSQSFALKKQA
jgi:hypothetical protein